MSQSVLDTIGRTPLIPLHRLVRGVPAEVLVKLESLNPGGSIKDRVGVAMVEEAERRGLAATGRNDHRGDGRQHGRRPGLGGVGQGISLHLRLAGQDEWREDPALKAYGAEIVITPTAVPPDSPESYNGVADRLAREIPGAWRPNQFANLANPEIHYRTTGPEIWEQTGGKITAFVAGVGTGGTISGVGRYLKERNPAIKIIGADPGGLGPLGRRSQAVEGRGNRRGFRSQDVERPGRRRVDPDRRRRELSHGPGHGAARGALGRRLVRNGRGGRAAITPSGSPATTSSSLSVPIPDVII